MNNKLLITFIKLFAIINVWTIMLVIFEAMKGGFGGSVFSALLNEVILGPGFVIAFILPIVLALFVELEWKKAIKYNLIFCASIVLLICAVSMIKQIPENTYFLLIPAFPLIFAVLMLLGAIARKILNHNNFYVRLLIIPFPLLLFIPFVL